MKESVQSRFDAKYVIDPISGCWNWTAAKYYNGYGVFAMRRGENHTAHRAAWLIYMGTEPGKLDVCHHCDNRGCVNPSHLFLGTRQENMMDRVRKGRHPRKANKGEANGRAKLTDRDVRAIKGMPGTHAHAARVFGISEFVISGIRKGRFWSHVT